jgi:hypothetical protein
MPMLKFSKANAKLANMVKVPELASQLSGKRKVYSMDSGLSGWTCPFAQDCLSKVYTLETGKRKVVDGPKTQFRCFSASQEALFTNVYNQRKKQTEILRSQGDKWGMAAAIIEALPNDAGIIRWNVAGDIFSQEYFDALIIVANSAPGVLFYAYTKSLPYWEARLNDIPDNFILTASEGGRRDDLIAKHNLRFVKVVYSEQQAADLRLPIDHDDSHASRPDLRNESFALLIHGAQPAGSDAGKAVRALKGKGSYSK